NHAGLIRPAGDAQVVPADHAPLDADRAQVARDIDPAAECANAAQDRAVDPQAAELAGERLDTAGAFAVAPREVAPDGGRPHVAGCPTPATLQADAADKRAVDHESGEPAAGLDGAGVVAGAAHDAAANQDGANVARALDAAAVGAGASKQAADVHA